MEDEHYSSDEGEVFFGSLAESEISKRRRFLGENYNSPVTPRTPRFHHAAGGGQGNLPDVLGPSSTQTPVQTQLRLASSSRDQSTDDTPCDSPSSSDNDVIVLNSTGNSVSVIVLSDDSFVGNEYIDQKSVKSEGRNESMVDDESPHKSGVNNTENIGNNNCVLKNDEINNLNITADKSCELKSNSKANSSTLVCDISEFDEGENKNKASQPGSISDIHNKDDNAELSKGHYESFSSDKDFVTDSVTLEFGTNNSKHEDSLLKFNMECSLVQDINNFIGDSVVLEKCPDPVNQIIVGNSSVIVNYSQSHSPSQLNSAEKSPEISSFSALESTSLVVPSELQKNGNDSEMMTDNSAKNYGKSSFDVSGLRNLEFSLHGITPEEFLNISYGSSLPSPLGFQSASPKFPKQTLTKDVSCDGEQLQDITEISNVAEKTNIENEDLHMSVDEVDFQQQTFSDDFGASGILGTSIDISQPSEYRSCLSAQSSYITAYNTTCGHSTSEQSDSFQNYRDVSTDLPIETDTVSIKSDEENLNVASFEKVMQNRQNSFNGTPRPKMSKNNIEGEPNTVSKLPIYQNSKSLLRPPKLCVKPDTLNKTSYKFAKQISKVENEKSTSNFPKPGLFKLSGAKPSSIIKHTDVGSVKENKSPLGQNKTFSKTPAKIISPKQTLVSINKTPKETLSLAKVKTPSLDSLSVNKTQTNQAASRTPALIKSGIPRAVKSDSKGKKVLTPAKSCNSIEKSAERNTSLKKKLRNVISPIQAYIRGSPPVMQRKAQVINEEQEICSPEGKKVYQSPRKITPMKAVPRVVQKLKYENPQGQENENPNVPNLTRDTIPCKVLEPSLEVFWKEQQQPQRQLPKMGEKLTKILAGPPQAKLTVHEGRVKTSPNCKGILVPNEENSPPSSSGTFVEDNLPEGRISVRIQKIVDHP